MIEPAAADVEVAKSAAWEGGICSCTNFTMLVSTGDLEGDLCNREVHLPFSLDVLEVSSEFVCEAAAAAAASLFLSWISL